MIYPSGMESRNINAKAAITENRRVIATYLRHGAEMIQEGESATYQPDQLGYRDKAWVERGEAEVCLTGLLKRLGFAKGVKVLPQGNDKPPIFIVHR